MGSIYNSKHTYKMIDYGKNYISQLRTHKGKGLVNTLINKLPFELHLPGYQYCGPGTKLQKRIARGDPGINSLDKACKEHDIFYSKYKNKEDRHIADRILSEKAWQRAKSSDADFKERANAWLVTNAMKAKVKFGMGVGRKSKTKKSSTRKLLQRAIQNARRTIRTKKPEAMKSAINIALKAAKDIVKTNKSTIEMPRVIPVPKVGGVLPFLIPLFAGLSAIGALGGSAAHIAKAVNAAKSAREQLAESSRHNKTMEAIAMGKGLHLKPYKNGLGLYLNSHSKN